VAPHTRCRTDVDRQPNHPQVTSEIACRRASAQTQPTSFGREMFSSAR
jgi:hypothetical protein